MSNATTVLLCGVGGQGTILAADLLARTALASNYDVKVSEIHGMSQRGGAVTTVVRFGAEPVATMVADHGCVDCVVSFETTEALRNLPFVREGGYLLVADESDALQIREGENSRVGWLPAERLLEYTNEWQMDGVYAKLLARARELLRNA